MTGAWLRVDLGAMYYLDRVDYLPRQDSANGRYNSYMLFVSNTRGPDSARLSPEDANGHWGDPVAEGNWPNNTTLQTLTFDWTNGVGRYVILYAPGHGYNTTANAVKELTIYGGTIALADSQTGSRLVTNSNTVDVAAFFIPPGYDQYQINQITDVNSLPGPWISTNTQPTTVTFAEPNPEDEVFVQAWFNDSSATLPVTNLTTSITYVKDTADVAAVAQATLSVLTWGAAWPAAIHLVDIENGSSSSIGIYSYTISAPEDQTPGDPHTVSLVDPGDYTVTLTVTDIAGNTATDMTVVTVTAGPSPQVTAWTGGAGNTDWFNHDNWSNASPGPDAVATMESGTIVLTASTAPLASFTQTGGTLTFRGWNTILNADTVVIGGTVTHELNSDTTGTRLAYPGDWEPDNRVQIEAVDVTVNGTINVQEKGYAGASGGALAYGPGAATAERGAASHAGRTYGYREHAFTYGSLTEPTDPGSGGAGNYGGTGRPGGGVVRIDASGTVTVNGTINANGGNCSGQGGGASGGSVWITCNVLAGESGAIRANGGNAPSHGGGGGGRVAVHVNPTAQAAAARPDVNLSARHGVGTGAGTGNNSSGQHGTVYITSRELISYALADAYGYYSGLSEWTFDFDNWTVTDSDLIFPTNTAFTVTNDMTLTNSRIDSIQAGIGGDALGMDLTARNLTLSGGSLFHVYAAATNGVTPYGARVAIAETLAVTGNSILYPTAHPSNGGAVSFVVSNLTLEAGSTIEGEGRGFSAGNRRGGGTGRGGGGHGGAGGTVSIPNYVGGSPYGNAAEPTLPGSGSDHRAGGSVFWLEADGTVILDGTLSMRGAAGVNNAGAGAGGAVYIRCLRLEGIGSIDAGGGDTSGSSGGGGGGRIAVYFNVDQMGSDKAAAAGGVHSTSPALSGDEGSIVWEWDAMGLQALWVLGDPEPHGTSTPYAYGLNTVEQNSTVTVTVDSPTDELDGQHYICIGWQATNELGQVTGSGSINEAQFTVATNTWLTWYWTNGWNLVTSAGVNGSLSVDRTGWYTHGETVSVQAVPESGYHFVQWIGDVPDANRGSNPVTLTMNQRRTVQAIVASNTPGEKTWSGTGSWFGNPENWSPTGHPGENDTVTIAAGSTCNLYDPTAVASLTVNGTLNAETIEGVPNAVDNLVTLTVNGDVVIDGAGAKLRLNKSSLHGAGDLMLLAGGQLDVHSRATSIPADYDDTHPPATEYGALVRVAGNMTVNAGCKINPYAHPTDGGVPKFEMRNLYVADGAEFDANHRGFSAGRGPGHTTNRGGAGYGGEGGDAYSAMLGGPSYGSTNAPVQPGSGASSGRYGGGTIWIEATGAVEIDGTLTCYGQAGQHDIGTGSGGSIYIICRRFQGAETGFLNARGGDTSGSSGGGGGGRIAVWSTSNTFNKDNALVRGGTAETTTFDGNREPGRPGSLVWGYIPPRGTLLLLR